jgi:hypothetical protein
LHVANKVILRLPTKFQIQAKTRAEDIAERLGARRTVAAKKGLEQDPMPEPEEVEEGDEGISEILSDEDVDEMEVDEADQEEVEEEVSEDVAP